MTRPVRIQLKRTKGWRMPENTVKVDRTTRFGNPHKIGDVDEWFYGHSDPLTREEVVEGAYRFFSAMAVDPSFLIPLRGKNLACWCPLDQPCHADVLLELANAPLCSDCPPHQYPSEKTRCEPCPRRQA